MSDTTRYLRPEVLSKLSRLELRARAAVDGFLSGLHKSPYHGFSVEFAGYREYTPGDDVRHIDWRVFAKSDRFYIKQYEEETNLRAHLLLDCSGSMAYPEHAAAERMTKWDYAATVAASIGYLLTRQRDAVGLVLFDERIRQQLPSAASQRQLHDLIAVIEGHKPQHSTDLRTLFAHLADHVGRRNMVILISDLLTDLGELTSGLQRLAQARHEILVLHVLDQDELEFPFADRTLFEGMETRRELLTDPQSLRQSYLRAVESFIHHIRSFCTDRRITYHLLSTREPLNVALSLFLAQRMHAIRSTA